jgi:hypothetical protein
MRRMSRSIALRRCGHGAASRPSPLTATVIYVVVAHVAEVADAYRGS